MFHPGVWVKNFALNGLGRIHGATPLNLVVDNDTVKSTALRLPASPPGVEPWTHLTSVAFDVPPLETPWEELTIQDRSLFIGFADLTFSLPSCQKVERARFLRRLTLAWAICYSTVTPVMIYWLWTRLGG